MPRSPRAPLVLLASAMALVMAVAGTACSNDAEGAAPDASPSDDSDTDNPTLRPELATDADSVLVLGDSLVNGARLFGDLGDRLDAAGFDTLEIVAEDGEGPDWAFEEIEPRGEVPEVVVIELGTNPDADPEGFAEIAGQLITALRERGAQHIAWLTPVHGSDDRYDEKIAILASTPGIDEVADWATLVHADPRRLAADGIHPTEEGYTDLAEFLVSTAAALAS